MRSLKYRKKYFGAIGHGCIIGDNCDLVPKNMYLGDNVMIQNRVSFISHQGCLIVKDNSVISTGCIIIPATHLPYPEVAFYRQAKNHIGDESRTISIEEDCWIGAGSILLSKAEIGRGSIVAAGSIVTKKFPPYAVIAGCPAKIIAVKFSKEDILRHEAALYRQENRLSKEYIDSLFEKEYNGLKCLDKFPADE